MCKSTQSCTAYATRSDCGSHCMHSRSCLLAVVSLTKQREVVLFVLFLSYISSNIAGRKTMHVSTLHFNQWSLTCIEVNATAIFNIKHEYGISIALLCYWSHCPVGHRTTSVKYFIKFLVGFGELWTMVSGFQDQNSLGRAALDQRPFVHKHQSFRIIYRWFFTLLWRLVPEIIGFWVALINMERKIKDKTNL